MLALVFVKKYHFLLTGIITIKVFVNNSACGYAQSVILPWSVINVFKRLCSDVVIWAIFVHAALIIFIEMAIVRLS